jgi:hypothetical protein
MQTTVAPPRARTMLVRATLCAGLAVIVVGTFLPWLRSGRATRNSYATDGAVRRLLHVDGGLDAALRAWPFLSLACAVAAALVVLGRHRFGAGVAGLVALCAGAVAAGALLTSSRGLLRPATAGPAVTLAGSILTLLAVLACCTPLDRPTRRQE